VAVFTLADLVLRRSLVIVGPTKRTRLAISPDEATRILRRVRRRAAIILALGLLMMFAVSSGLSDPDQASWDALLLLASLFLIPIGAVGVVRWSRRLRSVRRHGWRGGRARISPAGWNRAEVTITFGHETRTVLTTRPVAVPIPFAIHKSDIYLGGAGEHLTVLLRGAPVLVPAKPAQM
jgi:hypothetical protein